MKSKTKDILKRIPFLKRLAGHSPDYFSPIVDINEVRRREKLIWKDTPLNGINLNSQSQLALLKEFESYYKDLDFPELKNAANRYYYANDYYSYTDGIILHSFLRHFKPNHVIEVGSGFSSALMLDIREKHQLATKFTFIEPYPENRLLSLLKENDKNNCRIIKEVVQDIPLSEFEILQAGDFLFIDSSHVSKTGSDLNYLLFDVIPSLKKGVFIHFHDIFYPFEYPKEWVYRGHSWNEDYLLRAFLAYNDSFTIKLFSHYLHSKHSDAYKNMPLCYKNRGACLWLEKIK